MAHYRQVRIGDVIEYAGTEYLVEAMKIEPGQPVEIVLAAVNGTLLVMSVDELTAALSVKSEGPTANTATDRTELDGIPEAARVEALELLGHMREIETGYRSGNPTTASPGEPRHEYDPATRSLTQRVAAKAAELARSERSLWNLWARYSDNGAHGLVDRRKVHKARPPAGEVERPSAPSSHRHLEVVRATRHGAADKSEHFTEIEHSIGATRPGEMVMFDSDPLDIVAFDPDTGEPHDVQLTIALDVCTRSLLAWRITTVESGPVDALTMLIEVLTPVPMQPDWPDSVHFRTLHVPFDVLVRHDARFATASACPVVLPETIGIQRGRIPTTESFDEACLRLGISTGFPAGGHGTETAVTNRLFSTIRTQFSEHVAGYRDRSTRNGRRPDPQPCWTIEELDDFFTDYVILRACVPIGCVRRP